MILFVKFSNTTQTIPIQVSCIVDDIVQQTAYVLSTESIEIEFDDYIDKNYDIKFLFAGKENIENDYVADAAIVIDHITIDGIDISPILIHTASYTHKTNGQTETITTEYTNFIGFDGTIRFQIQTPIFKWLYRNYCW